jgi:plastocyanin
MIDRTHNGSKMIAAGRAGLALGLIVTLGAAAPAPAAYEAGAVANGGSISGLIKYKGTPPPRASLEVNKDKEACGGAKESRELVVGADGGIQYVVVSIPGIAKGKPFPEAKSQLDQKGCEYTPHISIVPAGGELEIVNSDGILHNIHTYPQENKNPAVNRAQPKFKKTINEKFAQPERIKLGCDVHGWMQGWLIVENNPYVAITDEKGNFKITDIPPGDYEVTIWQEKLGETKQKVTVPAGGNATVNAELAGK